MHQIDKNHDNHDKIYDVAIIGAGISGLYCAKFLSEMNIIVFEKDRIGGRIYTHQKPQYEIGAGRFNRSHKILWSLIKQYNLEKEIIKISSSKYYLDVISGHSTHTNLYNVEKYINNCMTYVIKVKLTDSLRKITFYKHCIQCLGKKNADLLFHFYGYYSEFKVLNAYDAIILFTSSNTYYVMKNGLQSITDKMYKDCKDKCVTFKFENVKLVENVTLVKKDIIKVNNIYTKNVIFTIPTSLLISFPILKPLYSSINIPVVMPLIRIYADYGIKFEHKITTSSFLKYIIPIKDTLVMISYTDGKNVEPFLNGNKLKSEKIIQKMIQAELKKMLGDVPEPKYFKCHYWPIGTHSWPINVHSDEIANKMINPLPNIYICGDGFSHKQGWMEGSLETAKEVVKNYKNSI